MPTFWDRIQSVFRAAMYAWKGQESFYNSYASKEGLSVEERERQDKYKLLWQYYLGEHKQHLRILPNQPNDNVIINHSQRIVDDGVSFLFGKELRWEIEEGGEQTEEEIYLDTVWRSSEYKMMLLNDAALNGGVCGDVYFQILPVGDNLPPKLVNLAPSVVFPVMNPDDCEEMWAYQIRYLSASNLTRVIWSLHSTDEAKEVSQEGVAQSSDRHPSDEPYWVFWTEIFRGGRWEEIKQKQIWPWPWPNIVHGKNLPNPNSFFGRSDLEEADMNDAINFIASNTNRIIRLHAHPIPVGKMMNAKELDISPGKAILPQSKDADLKLLEMTSKLESSQMHLSRLTSDYYKICRVPELEPETTKLGAQSGFALRVLYGPLLAKTETKRRLYGSVIVELNKRLLEMNGMELKNPLHLHWQDPLPLDERTQVENDKFEMDYGVTSVQTIRSRRGIDHQTEEARFEEQKVQAGNVGDEILRRFEQGL